MANEVSEADDKMLRYRRTKSVTRAEEIRTKEARVRKSQPDKPCHKPRDSLFSWSSDFNNFTGFVNWAFLLLTVGGVRLLLENLIKYGIRVNPGEWLCIIQGSSDEAQEYSSVILVGYSLVPVSLTLLLERSLSSETISEKVGMLAHILNIVVMVIIPMVVINLKNSFTLFGATTVCTVYSVLFLKLWSYIHVNSWCRNKSFLQERIRRQSLSYSVLNKYHENACNGNSNNAEDNISLVQYPNNLNFKDIFYYIFAPTLCYELNFPRTNRIRKRFLLKRLIEVVVGCQVVMSLFQQWIIPSVKNSLIPFSNMDIAKATERLLKLAAFVHSISR